MTITQAMVLAAGLGTRMRPITETTPKPLVKIGGKAMIDYALDTLKEAGVTTVVVNVHHHADQMQRHLASIDGLEIIISDERERLMDSGGGLARGLKLLDPAMPALVMNADLFWIGETKGEPSNLTRLGKRFDPEMMDMAMLCVAESQTTGHNGKNDFSMAADGGLTRYRVGDPDPVVYAGALALMPGLLADAPKEPFNLNIYFDRAIAARRLFGERLQGHWLTVGTPDAIAPAEAKIALSRQES
ncbi:nucleotidyltransferase family protein [Rhizobium sp. AG855]|uniref:nucleotidyltransferase family protein n=1 Tax=Rhizobium sp. AG855 TaxID=2183898 RepID=UPI000E7406E7|nr:nucleotidyltransferase family protein [Rhizobium sp. AG855]RKE79844.1 MurNAc alpha-1-phosphate uridylyltransferase [Rhizobium sp. AG855]